MKVLLIVFLLTAVSSQEYLGCFRDNPTKRVLARRALRTTSLTIESCINECKTSANSHAGVEFGVECFCGDNVKLTQKGPRRNDGGCDITCSGDSSQICGGRGRINIYSVCDRGRYRNRADDCDNRCYCRDEDICRYSDGRCLNGCVSGWTGDSCQFIDCDVNNGRCSQICTPAMRQDACSCRAGFQPDGLHCTDVDECELGTSECSHNCINTEDSYSCWCEAGFYLPPGELHVCSEVKNGVHSSTLVAGIAIPILIIIIIIILVMHCMYKRRTEHRSHSTDAVHSSTALGDLAAGEKDTDYEDVGLSSTYTGLDVTTMSTPHSVYATCKPTG